MYAASAAAGSLAGAALTYWVGKKVGDVGLERLVPAGRLERMRSRARSTGAIALALPGLLPPPFPLTPFVLTCGALEVDPIKFFVTFGTVRVLRFGTEAVLARLYGRGILRVLESDFFQSIVIVFIVIAAIGTAVSAVLLWTSTRRPTGPTIGQSKPVRPA